MLGDGSGNRPQGSQTQILLPISHCAIKFVLCKAVFVTMGLACQELSLWVSRSGTTPMR